MCSGFVCEIGDRHLVGAEGAFDLHAVHHLRPGPALGGAQHDHGPLRPRRTGPRHLRFFASMLLDLANLVDRGFQRRGHLLMHRLRLVALHEVGLVPIAAQQFRQLFLADARQHGGAGDLVAVEVQDGQHRAVARRIQELVGVPTGSERAGLGFAIADHAAHQQVGIVERRAVGVHQRVAQLAAFVDGAGRFGRRVARDSAGKGELLEEPPHALGILRDVGIDLAVRPFQVSVGDHARAAVSRSADVDHVEVVLPDEPVAVDVDEIQAGGGAPVAQQAGLDVFELQRLGEQGIVVEINLSDRQIIGRAPVSIQAADFVLRQQVHTTIMRVRL